MKKKTRKDKNNRNLNFLFETKRIILKSLKKNSNLTRLTNWKSTSFLTNSELNYSTVQLVNRCVLSDRKNKFTKNLHISRLQFLKVARNGFLNGLSKSSW